MTEAEAVATRLGEELAQAEEELAGFMARLPSAQEEHRVACREEAEHDPDQPLPDEVRIRSDRAYRAVLGLIDRIRFTKARVATLKDPAELERRINVNRHMSGVRERSTKVPKETAREAGVPEVYLAEDTGRFRIGMDARYKSDLVNSAVGIVTKEKPGDSLMQFTPADAEKRLEKQGWTSFLDRKKELLAEKSKKSAEAQAKREVQQRERAEAKAKKDAEKQAEKEKKASERESSKATTSGKSSGKPSASDIARQQREAKAEKAEQAKATA